MSESLLNTYFFSTYIYIYVHIPMQIITLVPVPIPIPTVYLYMHIQKHIWINTYICTCMYKYLYLYLYLHEKEIIKLLVSFFWVVCFIFLYPEPYSEYGSGYPKWILFVPVPAPQPCLFPSHFSLFSLPPFHIFSPKWYGWYFCLFPGGGGSSIYTPDLYPQHNLKTSWIMDVKKSQLSKPSWA